MGFFQRVVYICVGITLLGFGNSSLALQCAHLIAGIDNPDFDSKFWKQPNLNFAVTSPNGALKLSASTPRELELALIEAWHLTFWRSLEFSFLTEDGSSRKVQVQHFRSAPTTSEHEAKVFEELSQILEAGGRIVSRGGKTAFPQLGKPVIEIQSVDGENLDVPVDRIVMESIRLLPRSDPPPSNMKKLRPSELARRAGLTLQTAVSENGLFTMISGEEFPMPSVSESQSSRGTVIEFNGNWLCEPGIYLQLRSEISKSQWGPFVIELDSELLHSGDDYYINPSTNKGVRTATTIEGINVPEVNRFLWVIGKFPALGLLSHELVFQRPIPASKVLKIWAPDEMARVSIIRRLSQSGIQRTRLEEWEQKILLMPASAKK